MQNYFSGSDEKEKEPPDSDAADVSVSRFFKRTERGGSRNTSDQNKELKKETARKEAAISRTKCLQYTVWPVGVTVALLVDRSKGGNLQ